MFGVIQGGSNILEIEIQSTQKFGESVSFHTSGKIR
jgi:hypothetical protein